MRYAIASVCSVLCIVVMLIVPLVFIGDFITIVKVAAVFNAITLPLVTMDVWSWATDRHHY